MTTKFDGAATSEAPYSGNQRIDALIGSGIKWGGTLGTGATLTFSFPTSKTNFETEAENEWGLGYNPAQELSGFSAMTEGQKTAVRQVLAQWAEVANLTFTEVPDNDTEVGDLRFSNSSYVGKTAAGWAYYPTSLPIGGDVWIDGNNKFNHTLAPGQGGFSVLLHEVGHAIGLVTSN